MKIIAAAAFLAAPWQPAHAQAIVGSSNWSPISLHETYIKGRSPCHCGETLGVDRRVRIVSKLTSRIHLATSENGPSVWTGRALQAESDDLEKLV